MKAGTVQDWENNPLTGKEHSSEHISRFELTSQGKITAR